jgi:uracil-DNA glycosylase
VSDGRALAREFLEQQRLLGGDTVILDGPPDRRTAGPPVCQEAPPPAAPPPPPTARPSDRLGTELPPSGIAFDPPGGDLFSDDPVPQAASLDAVAGLVATCTKCALCEGRTHTVPGEGPDDARLVVVGEGPGRVEDETGRPFVGPAGELLTKILAAIDLPRERVFICNVVKCRPPENRVPQYDEIAACVPYLFRQIELVKPTVILAMGGIAAQTLLNTKQSLGAMRNQVHRFRGIPVIVTYHPAALLRNPNWKKPTWDDVRIARRLLG